MTRQKYLQLINIAANQLKLDEETYRQLLKNLTGQSSAKSLSTIDLNRVLNALKRQGFRIKKQQATVSTAYYPQLEKIRALWHQMASKGIVRDASEQAMGRFIKRETGIDSPQWLNSQQASQVIERLKKWQQRAK
ncbi:transcriptional regulator [Arsenophonus sp. ENCA]|uniref:gp16 family protein n=1 Tax=Arsenophonus sp. ENCA TaxID=1987579 RepID=UPI000BDB71C1|nr:regulatory protein GemA [Arsenophonus sp. ENCA]PAV02751.1 transcriptional regulator [Arsenophonus sp. ENCA]